MLSVQHVCRCFSSVRVFLSHKQNIVGLRPGDIAPPILLLHIYYIFCSMTLRLLSACSLPHLAQITLFCFHYIQRVKPAGNPASLITPALSMTA